MTRLIAFALAASIAACTAPFAGNDGRATLQRERAAWQAQAIHAYSYDYRQSCFCPDEITEPVRIEVRNDTVHSVISRRTQLALPLGRAFGGGWPTVDSLFAHAERLYQAGQYTIDIAYDATYRFPTRLNADIPVAVDDELSITATNLVKTP
jgi:hypothetical protein